MFIVLVAASLLGLGLALPGGAPDGACNIISPVNNNAHTLISTTGMNQPFQLTIAPQVLPDSIIDVCDCSYRPGGFYSVTLMSPVNLTFQGFLIVAVQRTNITRRLGTFLIVDSANSQLACNDDRGVTHVNQQNKTSITATWIAPTNNLTEDIQFRYSVVVTPPESYGNQYGPVFSAPIALQPQSEGSATTSGDSATTSGGSAPTSGGSAPTSGGGATTMVSKLVLGTAAAIIMLAIAL